MRTAHDETQIKATAYEFAVRETDVMVHITRANDVVQHTKLTASVQAVAAQRVDMTLQTKPKGGAGEACGGHGLQGSSMMDMTLLSSDSERFHSCYSNHNNSTVYHDMSQFGMASAAVGLGETVADPMMQMASAGQAGRNVKNLFVFSQLTNVVNRFTSMGEFHVCRQTLLEVVRLKKDPQKCLMMSSTKSAGQKQRHGVAQAQAQAETKVFIGKVFVNVTESELLLALSLKGPPSVARDEDQVQEAEEAQP